jgi:TRAP-type C4-dicarboxylate transport system substrate-binding protein
MRTSATRICSVVAGVFLLALFLSVPVFSAEEPIAKLKYAGFMPPGHPISVLSEQWCKELDTKTNGRVKTTYYTANTLIPAAQIYDGVVKGIADFGWSVVAYTPGRMPLTEGFILPLGYKSCAQGTRAMNEYYQKFKPKEFDDVKLLYLHGFRFVGIHTKKQVTKMDDLKGLRIKGDGGNVGIIAATGATPTVMPMIELYDGLKRGVCDGSFHPMEALKAWKLAEICHYTYQNTSLIAANPFFVAMNKAKWNALPPDIQQIIEKMSVEYMAKQGKLWDDLDADAVEFVKKTHTFTRATPEEEARTREKMVPLLDTYVKNTKAKGLPGDELVKWVQNYVQTTPAN